MDVVLIELASAMLRWLHVIAGIAWIGSSFYFIHLDLSLRARSHLPPGVKGEAWQVHGGGFYNMLKYVVAPANMPDELTWFKWEAYTTWLSGFGLLVIVYYLGADLFLVDRTVLDVSVSRAIALSLGLLLASWLGYEVLCRSPVGRHELALSLILYAALVGLTLIFTHVFSGRGAFNQIGALIGTIMVANVFIVIIPNQKKMVASLLRGEPPEAALGAQGKQRSLHNNYLTLPVIFLMVSNHYPLLFATRYNWLIVAVVLAIGPVIRHFYNTRHAGQGTLYWPWIVALIGAGAIAFLSAQGPSVKVSAANGDVSFADASEVVISRCAMCHAPEPVWAGIAAPPHGVMLDTPERVLRHARMIDIYAVRSNAMPPGNLTEVTAGERATLAAWIASGAAGK